MTTGGYAWTQAHAQFYQQRPGTVPIILVPQPSILDGDWASLCAKAELCGPTEAVKAAYLNKTTNHGPLCTVSVYAPEDRATSHNVPEWENTHMEECLAEARDRAAEVGVLFGYAPGFTLLCTEFEWGGDYVFNTQLIQTLASMVPQGTPWILRIRQLEARFFKPRQPADPVGFLNAVQDYLGVIFEANPYLDIIIHLSAPSVVKFSQYHNALDSLDYPFYAGISPTCPVTTLEQLLNL